MQVKLRFLEEKCVDPEDGRMFFHVSRDGTPLRKRRYAYSESFAAVAFAAHAGATGSDASAARARHWFKRFVDWNFLPNDAPPKFTGKRPLVSLGPLMITLATAQELESRLGPSEETREWINRCIHDMRTLFVTCARHGLDAAALARHPDAGRLLALRVSVAGVPVARFADG